MDEKFLIAPKSIKKSDILKKVFSLHPAEYKKIDIKNQNQKTIHQLVDFEGVGGQIEVNNYLNFDSDYILVTISNMNNCIIDEKQGEKISPQVYLNSSKKLKKGDVLISRNASLGKITLVNKDIKGILNGGISYLRLSDDIKYYVFAYFLLDYGKDYLTVLTSGGGTQKNAKRQNLLDVKIPFPNSHNHKDPKKVENLVSLITQNILDKEEQIIIRQNLIDNFIYAELKNNQNSEFKYFLPKKSDLVNVKRIDTGLYTKKYKIENHLIENYKNGFFKIDISNFKSGSTPKTRIFNSQKSTLKWVTPTNITDEGFYIPTEKISMPSSYNLKKDSILFINRTSKGKKGEYVGITSFYNFEYYGNGHHNQGIYRVDNFEKNEMLYITAFMNSKIMRKICGNISTGSKMKEMKANDFSILKFPNFNKEQKEEISRMYYNPLPTIFLNFENYLYNHKQRNQKLGVFQLNQEILELKETLKSIITKIINNQPIVIK